MAGSKAVAGIKSVSLDTLLPMWKKLPINIGIIMQSYSPRSFAL